MIDRGRKALDTPFHLFSFGLVGVATIILFSVASASFLTADNKPLIVSSSGEGILRQTDGNAAPIPAPTYLPPLDPANVPPPFPSQGAPTSQTAEATGTRPGSELPSPEHDASATISKARDASLIQDSQIAETKLVEVGGSDQPITELLPVVDEGIARAGASRMTARSEIPREGGDQSYHSEIDQNQSIKLNQSNAILDEKGPSHKNQVSPVHRLRLSLNTAFHDRVQKECGPIIFPPCGATVWPRSVVIIDEAESGKSSRRSRCAALTYGCQTLHRPHPYCGRAGGQR
jgi:hypothetical protein